eukprot:TRINITY_DN7688_c0_g1_i3.p3 TRINITY_DN7688_c0_g1~~TRINITY_DN7688_c0_g1_i3.p3  ORF type:complete len:252 (-),score=117.01 TRINITY_DN7688_c0_g1_i3:27-782(-)
MGIKYTNNELFFDVVEELHAIVDANGQVVSSDITGKIEANSRLSGLPDALLTFVNPQVMVDAAFHPCVRFSRFEQDRSLSFVPPDGHFELATYRAVYQGLAPFYVTPKLSFHRDTGRLNVMLGLKAGSKDVAEKGVQDVRVSVTLPEAADSVRLDASQGNFSFDTMTKELRWDVGRIGQQRSPSLSGTIHATSGAEFDAHAAPSVLVDFRLPMTILSGLKIDTVSLTNEKYKPYKGVRSITKAGHYEFRTA